MAEKIKNFISSSFLKKQESSTDQENSDPELNRSETSQDKTSKNGKEKDSVQNVNVNESKLFALKELKNFGLIDTIRKSTSSDNKCDQNEDSVKHLTEKNRISSEIPDTSEKLTKEKESKTSSAPRPNSLDVKVTPADAKSKFADTEKSMPDGAEAKKTEIKCVEEIKKTKLIILDLNDVLICRVKRHILTRMRRNNSHPTTRKFLFSKFSEDVYTRPGLDTFLKFIFKYFYVGIWSSAKPYNIAFLVDHIFSPEQLQMIQFIMSQDDCIIKRRSRPLIPIKKKPLRRMWDSSEYNPKNLFNETNTIFIDDSMEPNSENPGNCIIVPTFDVSDPECNNDGVLNELMVYLLPLTENKKDMDVQDYLSEFPFSSKFDPTTDFVKFVSSMKTRYT